MLQRVPAAGVWHVLSDSIVRLMLNHTHGEDSHLLSLVKTTLQQLPGLVHDDQEVGIVLTVHVSRRDCPMTRAYVCGICVCVRVRSSRCCAQRRLVSEFPAL